jgi:hypothetical protein
MTAMAAWRAWCKSVGYNADYDMVNWQLQALDTALPQLSNVQFIRYPGRTSSEYARFTVPGEERYIAELYINPWGFHRLEDSTKSERRYDEVTGQWHQHESHVVLFDVAVYERAGAATWLSVLSSKDDELGARVCGLKVTDLRTLAKLSTLVEEAQIKAKAEAAKKDAENSGCVLV